MLNWNHWFSDVYEDALYEAKASKIQKAEIIKNDFLAYKKGDTLFNFFQQNKGSTNQLQLELQKVLDRVNYQIRNNKELYQENELISKDPILGSAVEIMADSSLKRDEHNNKYVWIESDDKELCKELNDFLNNSRINENATDIVEAMLTHGDEYVELHYKDEKNLKDLQPYMTFSSKPYNIVDIQDKGKTVFYAKLREELEINHYDNYQNAITETANTADLIDNRKYIHFIYRKKTRSPKINIITDKQAFDKVKYEYLNRKDISVVDNKTNEKINKYLVRLSVNKGSSLFDTIRSIYRILKTVENSIFTTRLAKAHLIRIFNLEVGDAGPKESRTMVNAIKSLLNLSTNIDSQRGLTSIGGYNTPSDPIVVPNRNGSGRLDPAIIGGDMEVISLTDLDYWNNKVFAGIKIPKPYLGFIESMPGFSGAPTLDKIDERVNRTLARVNKAFYDGVNTFIKLRLISIDRLDALDKFKLCMIPVSSIDELEKIREATEKINFYSSLAQTLDNMFNGLYDRKKLLELFLSKLQIHGLSDIILKKGEWLPQGMSATDWALKEATNQQGIDSILNPPPPEEEQSMEEEGGYE